MWACTQWSNALVQTVFRPKSLFQGRPIPSTDSAWSSIWLFLKVLCLNLLVRIVYIFHLNHLYPWMSNYYRKLNLLKKCGPQIRLCLFMFRPISLKQLNSWTTVDTFSWLGGPEVTYPTAVQEVPVSIPGYGKGFDVWFYLFWCCCALNFCLKHIICHEILKFLL